MNSQTQPKFAKGIRLRHDRDGSVMLLVPEGALVLNRSAAAALALVDGKRRMGEIVAAIVDRFDVTPQRAKTDLHELFDRLGRRGFIIIRQPIDEARAGRSRSARGESSKE
jgi:pyrroloquinoline quinone biosynthesis protein D